MYLPLGEWQLMPSSRNESRQWLFTSRIASACNPSAPSIGDWKSFGTQEFEEYKIPASRRYVSYVNFKGSEENPWMLQSPAAWYNAARGRGSRGGQPGCRPRRFPPDSLGSGNRGAAETDPRSRLTFCVTPSIRPNNRKPRLACGC
jgi:hypothetical protein